MHSNEVATSVQVCWVDLIGVLLAAVQVCACGTREKAEWIQSRIVSVVMVAVKISTLK